MSAMAEARSRRQRRRFTDEFKQQAVRLVLDEGKSVTAVARELDLVASARLYDDGRQLGLAIGSTAKGPDDVRCEHEEDEAQAGCQNTGREPAGSSQ